MKRYEICIRGSPGPIVTEAFRDLTVAPAGNDTVLIASVRSQAELHAILERIRDLGIQLNWAREATSAHREPP